MDYVEIDFPSDVNLEWRRFVPNVWYSHSLQDANNSLRMVGLIATADIQRGHELYSSYLTVMKT